MHDLLLVQSYVVDPRNGINGIRDILVSSGRIVQVAPSVSVKRVRNTIDMKGDLVIPGMIDSHVHVSGPMDPGFTMLAKAGVTTAIDFCGPVEDIMKRTAARGIPIHIGVLEMVRPGHNLPDDTWNTGDIHRAVERALDDGALGVKVLGGHFPLDSVTTREIFLHANTLGCYTAFHAGTREVSEPFPAFRQAVNLSEGLFVHIAHINSYCRGRYKGYIQEMAEAVELLQNNTNIHSGSYLSDLNGTFGGCRSSMPVSAVTRGELSAGGYPVTEKGLEEALFDGFAQVCAPVGDEVLLKSGEEGVKVWRNAETRTMICFSVNPAANASALALHRGYSGAFTVDVINTDGGGIPRNCMIDLGLPLTRFREFSLEDFVLKTSLAPAMLFGMGSKGHLGEGADADITVIDRQQCRPRMSFVSGVLTFSDGQVVGNAGKLITSRRGSAHAAASGIGYTAVDVSQGSFYRRRN